jgi:hypothetical protein
MVYVPMLSIENASQYLALKSCIQYLDDKIEELDFSALRGYLEDKYEKIESVKIQSGQEGEQNIDKIE